MKKVINILVILLLATSIQAQIYSPVKWSYAAKKTKAGEAIIYFKGTIEYGWHIYSLNQPPGGPLKTSFGFKPSDAYSLIGKVAEPNPVIEYEEAFKIDVFYFNDSVLFQQKIKLRKPTTKIIGKINYMACTKERCTPPLEVDFSIAIK